ncbi:hypothetical protein LJR168_000728 [Pseudoxanthomonas sp. LjRoot168]|uniref:hypothetical protein n=1 Tax=unclassified Pseudoxanthomonas TaxID=2645906 RepID=UPI003ECD2175
MRHPGKPTSRPGATAFGSSGSMRVRKSNRPRAGSRDTSTAPGENSERITSMRSPSEITAGATMLSNGQRSGVMNRQSTRSVERQ